ncbi:DUF4269 domain-containing protein [Mucilaginibacter roseus]|uniref:DUF4269 domain-containing protein n=1 Tax=Mucilaginibacter roseus TaxID=1528868 RepID=A0ABS8TXS9_9SPHI|nr:DUF4269 domain-containing protein [Mucilaginibacter roseus]MCD8739675.1 DUF4269 domain-containing protein [Mucilaginibacter roseus]
MELFDNIDYLQYGSPVQISAFQTLKKHLIIDLLEPYAPLLTGTIPIGINIEGSDLDIICCYHDQANFADNIIKLFNEFEGFKLTIDTCFVVAGFKADDWQIEVFGEAKPTRMQYAYRHMLVEYQLLQIHGDDFRAEIIRLKQHGCKTEPAFAKALGLTGNPYQALLDLEV